MKKPLFSFIPIFLLSVMINEGEAQDYFKVYDDAINYAETKIKRLANGDILLATSSYESLRNGGKDATLFCQRLDYCGQVIWSYAYKIPDDHIILNDIALLNQDELVLYGSIYQGLKESIFLIKINTRNGFNGELKVFNPGTVDHFTYSMDIIDENIIIYGLLLDFNTKKNGFVAQFNTKLNFIWANKFSPFESSGKAVVAPDKSIFCFSGNYLFKLTSKGSSQWAFEIKGGKTLKIIGGPILHIDGAVFEALQDSTHFLFKINQKGEKLWESERFPGTGIASAITHSSNGDLFISYLKNQMNQKYIAQLLLSKSGILENSSTFLLPKILKSTSLNQNLDANETNTLIGSIDPFLGKKGDINSFLLQYSIKDKSMDCLKLEPSTLKNISQTPVTLESITPQFSAFNMTQEKVFRPDTVTWNRMNTANCQLESKVLPKNVDTLLDCKSSWKITLPGSDYIWWDQDLNRERLISVPGIYKAYKLSCTDPGIILFTLKKNECDCPLFIPNAFSPNDDGIHDTLEFYSSCELHHYTWKIFSRWGDLIDQGVGGAWTGSKTGRPFPQDTYVMILHYTFKDASGKLQEGQKVQTINLLR
jgi:gliding motility-associated-like protein